MNKLNIIIISLLVIIVGVLVFRPSPPLGGAPPGLASSYATSSSITVPVYVNNPLVAVRLFATSTECAARTITTDENSLMVVFGEIGTTTYTTGTFGHIVGASSTITYDAGEYGCGTWKAVSNGVSAANVTVTEQH